MDIADKIAESDRIIKFLQKIDDGYEPSSSEYLALTEVESLSLNDWGNNYVPDSIRYLTNLKTLTISFSKVTSLDALQNLNNLVELYVIGAQVSDFQWITKLDKLRTLFFYSPSIESLDGLESLVHLQELYLDVSQVIKIDVLPHLVELQSLSLDTHPDTCLDPIATMTRLRELSLRTHQSIKISKFHKLVNLEGLSLSGVKQVCLEGIDKLEGLKALSMPNVEVLNPHELQKLTMLTDLNISHTGICDLSYIKKLTKLQSLTLTDTEVSNLQELSMLTTLKSLTISGAKITSTTGLEKLTNLEKLHLHDTEITDLSTLQALNKLIELNVSRSAITSIDGIQEFTNLQKLDISYTGVTYIPSWIGNLKNLISIDLSGLHLHSIPIELEQLNLPFSFSHVYRYDENDIRLRDTVLATQPISLFEQPRELIKAYYNAEQVPVNEAKVIFLGDGGVGKTHTIRRIHNNDEQGDYNTQTTPGISITNFAAQYNDHSFTIHFWDFGGQEIMHAMHRCFLTNRTCYVVVLSNRWDLDRQARYWLKNIDSFAKGASVILAINKWDNIRECAIDTTRLHNEYKNLIDVIFYSAKNSDVGEFQRLTNAIIEQAQSLDSCSMNLPVHWQAIRSEILTKAESQPYLDKEEYHKICADNGLETENIRTWLLEWFNDLGVCFSYHQNVQEKSELATYKVLNPAWLTNAIYKIINFGQDYAEKGIISKRSILDLLKSPGGGVLPGVTYNAQERDYVLEVMRKFNLSYPITPKNEFIPALCDPETPNNLHPDPISYKQHVAYKLEYKYLPDSVVHQLMIRCYKNLNPDVLWRKGLRIDYDDFNLSAVVDMGGSDSSLRIDVYAGGNIPSWELLQSLRNDLMEINHNLNLDAQDYIIITEGKGESSILVDMLLEMKAQGDSSLPVYNEADGLRRFSVNKLLGVTFGRENVEAALKQVRDGEGKMQDVIYNVTYQNCTFSDMHNRYSASNAESKALGLIQVLLQGQYDTNQKLIDCLIQSLKSANGNDQAQKLGSDMEKDLKEKKSPMKRFKEFIGDAADITTKGKAIAAALLPVITRLHEIAPEISEAIQGLFATLP